MPEQLDEQVDRLDEPVYPAYQYVRSLLTPGMRVLDVGCGNAKVSKYLAESGATVDGIEPAANRASVAAGRVRHLSTVDPTQTDDLELLAEYDVITFFDVLEHIVDPGPLLAWSAKRLAQAGRVIAVVPNSAHYTFRLKILRGDWRMEDWGLFDRTHVRFFDTHTARLLCPDGLQETDLQFFAAPGWQRRAASIRPNLFAFHVALTWTLAPQGATL